MIDVKSSIRENSQSKLKKFLASSSFLWHWLTNNPDYICDTIEEFKTRENQFSESSRVMFPQIIYRMERGGIFLTDFSKGIDIPKSIAVLLGLGAEKLRERYRFGTLHNAYIIKKMGKSTHLTRFNGDSYSNSSKESFSRIFPNVNPVFMN